MASARAEAFEIPARSKPSLRSLSNTATVTCGSLFPGRLAPLSRCSLPLYADEQGTLDGKPIPVHHLIATIAGAKIDLFASLENRLLQAELPQQGFVLLRNGFVLKPPAPRLRPRNS